LPVNTKLPAFGLASTDTSNVGAKPVMDIDPAPTAITSPSFTVG